MEGNGRVIQLPEKHLPRVLSYGLMFSCILIIFSVDYLYQNQKWIELIITSLLFAVMVLGVRWLNNAK